MLPDGAALNLNLRIPGVKHYNVNPMPTVTKHKLVHETVHPALTDTNLARLNLGVGEEVKFGFTPPFSWTVDWSASGGGLSDYPVWNDAAGETVANGTWFTAPSNAANVTVTASFFGVDGSLKTKFKVFEPTGYDTNRTYKVYDYTNAPYLLWGQGHSGAGMYIRVYVAPTGVSFYRLQGMEVGENATNITGYYTNYMSLPDYPSNLSHIGQGANDPFQINPDNSWQHVANYDWDHCEWGNYDPPPAWSAGSFTWIIPGAWSIGGSIWHTNMEYWSQLFTLQSDGTMTIQKFGQSVTRNPNSP